MPETGFHFANPWWLLALLAPPLVWLWLRNSTPRHDVNRYRAYADAHLLPHLLGLHTGARRNSLRPLLLLSGIWSLLVLAIAGPRWDYTDMQLFRPGSDLVVLLDLSLSMDVTDVAPSRLARARQEIEDLVEINDRARIGLIGFASVAHVIAPLTEDGSAVRQQLPAISTDLVQLKGSRLTEALLRARQMLAGQPAESSHHLLLISDGDFGDATHMAEVQALAEEGIHLHVLGVGSAEGAPVPGLQGRLPRGVSPGSVMSRLDIPAMQALAEAGAGIYRTADFDDADTRAVLAQLVNAGAAEQIANEKTRVWNERYHWLALPVMLLLLGRFRRPGRPDDMDWQR